MVRSVFGQGSLARKPSKEWSRSRRRTTKQTSGPGAIAGTSGAKRVRAVPGGVGTRPPVVKDRAIPPGALPKMTPQDTAEGVTVRGSGITGAIDAKIRPILRRSKIQQIRRKVHWRMKAVIRDENVPLGLMAGPWPRRSVRGGFNSRLKFNLIPRGRRPPTGSVDSKGRTHGEHATQGSAAVEALQNAEVDPRARHVLTELQDIGLGLGENVLQGGTGRVTETGVTESHTKFS